MGTILLKNITIDGQVRDMLIDRGLIARICPAGAVVLSAQGADAEIVDCSGKTALPGFVNMHTHAGMAMMRGIQEDTEFGDWITFNDQYWFSPAARRAALEMGIRPVVSYVILDKSGPWENVRQQEECIRLYEESRSWDDASRFAIAFHAIYSVSEPMILWAAQFARDHDLQLHIHLSETEEEVRGCQEDHGGLSPVQYLDQLGILDERLVAAHSLWLSEEDIRILGERKVNCVHNINSNLKLASGYHFYYEELRDAGANVCLGTDGCASSNNLDMLEAMKTTALLQKAWRRDPKAIPLQELLDTATRNGARALGINTGVLEEGREADLLIVDTDSTFFLSPGSFLANFIYSAHSDCIDSVIAGGRFVMRGRRVEGEEEILKEARKVLKQII